MGELFFVYGTLMSGYTHDVAQRFHQSSTFLSLGYMEGKLFDLGQYPAATYEPNSDSKVWGEIWVVQNFEEVSRMLDEYEGIFDNDPEYIRQKVAVISQTQSIFNCWTYLLNNSYPKSHFKYIVSGNYKL